MHLLPFPIYDGFGCARDAAQCGFLKLGIGILEDATASLFACAGVVGLRGDDS